MDVSHELIISVSVDSSSFNIKMNYYGTYHMGWIKCTNEISILNVVDMGRERYVYNIAFSVNFVPWFAYHLFDRILIKLKEIRIQ